MNIFIIRHAEAYPLGEHGITDDESRPLTPGGVDSARTLGRALAARGLRPALVLTSPLLRAKQTAAALVEGLGGSASRVEECEALAPGERFRRVAKALADHKTDAVALVGHQPDLGGLTGWLCGSKKVAIDFPKPGAACVRCDGEPGKGCGSLAWLASPEWFAPVESPAEE